jgi:hypothetical protein
MDDFIVPEMLVEEIGQKLIITFRKTVWGKRIEKITYPMNWLESIKERWMPKWLTNRYPIRYTTFEARAYYPHLKLPNDVAEIVFVKT